VPGDLDFSFSGDGKVTTNFTRRADFAIGMALQPDGKIVTAGVAGVGGPNPRFALARHTAEGALDPTFSSDGKLTTDLTPKDDAANSVTIDADGRIVAAGVIGVDGSDPKFAVVRYNPDGSLDTSFSGDGKVTIDVSDRSDNAFKMAIQPDGKIVVVGEGGFGGTRRDSKFALVRLTDTGTLDGSFGNDGKVLTQFTPRFEVALGVAIDGNDRIVAVGSAGAWVNKKWALARYNTDGSLDTSFSGDGKVMTDFTSRHEDASDVSIQQDGKIVAGGDAGYRFNRTADSKLALARYNTNGSLDSSFGGDGKVFTNFTRKEDGAARIAIQGDGKIVAAGWAGGFATFAIARYLP
jgi:uncharacterized delta-60 repeat protein